MDDKENCCDYGCTQSKNCPARNSIPTQSSRFDVLYGIGSILLAAVLTMVSVLLGLAVSMFFR